jgi:hypothetical protein
MAADAGDLSTAFARRETSASPADAVSGTRRFFLAPVCVFQSLGNIKQQQKLRDRYETDSLTPKQLTATTNEFGMYFFRSGPQDAVALHVNKSKNK